MCQQDALLNKQGDESRAKEDTAVRWVQVEFGGRVYLVPRS
jgi:hypothetical protein